MESKLPAELIDGFIILTRTILKENLTGIYLHGSAVMGCYNPDKSDLDLLIVVNRPLSDAEKRKFMDMVIQYDSMAPGKGIEMSVILKNVCDPFVYPTPFELHFSRMHADWYRKDPDDYVRNMNGTDKDLAAHIMILINRGKCLYGAPVNEVFSEVPANNYLDSIIGDIECAADEIADNTMYLTLNLCRVLAYKEDGLVLSKKEGGEWGLSNLPKEYHKLISDALNEYSGDAKTDFDVTLARRYADYMTGRINIS